MPKAKKTEEDPTIGARASERRKTLSDVRDAIGRLSDWDPQNHCGLNCALEIIDGMQTDVAAERNLAENARAAGAVVTSLVDAIRKPKPWPRVRLGEWAGSPEAAASVTGPAPDAGELEAECWRLAVLVMAGRLAAEADSYRIDAWMMLDQNPEGWAAAANLRQAAATKRREADKLFSYASTAGKGVDRG